MQYPLIEQIGDPDLLVGREKEFNNFNKWIDNIPKRLSKSRVILARRKSGKTAFVQRIFNRLWSENGAVIPFYFAFTEDKIWYPDLAIKYYRVFASQYISFLERDKKLVKEYLSLDEIKQYGIKNSIKPFITNIDLLIQDKNSESYDLMWENAISAPDRFAAYFDKRILVIIDEFQYSSNYVYLDQSKKIQNETLPGSWHNLVESKIAPMLVTGSYVGWLIQIMHKYLKAGRLKQIYMSPYLTEDEGLQAVYKYAEVYQEPITHESAEQINKLCMSDPFFISCVMQSEYEKRDLTTQEGVIDAVNYEISDRESEMSRTWGEYIEITLQRINDIHAKNIVLFMSKNADRDWTPKELKDALHLEIDTDEIHKRLRILVQSDLLKEGVSDIDYRAIKDGTLYLILRNRFEKEISSFTPDIKKGFNEELEKLKKDKKYLQGKLNNLLGKVAEFQLMTDFRTRKKFSLSQYFEGVEDLTVLNIINTMMRFKFQRADGKDMEIDVIAESDCGRVVLVEVKKTKEKTGLQIVKDFMEKIDAYKNRFMDKRVLPCFLSVGSFTDEAAHFCKGNGIGTAEMINYYQQE
ncbi:MAG: restriction endonuclease [Desulfobacterales bacterium]|nr:restriction endonuclease [Desulfobacterales bacterium]